MARRIDVPKVTVDFSQVEEFEPLEKGEYSAIIAKGTYVEAASDDKYDYINVEFDLTEPGAENRKAWKVWSLSPKALWRMKQDMENLGFDTEEELNIDYDEDTMEVTEPEIAGMPCVIVLTQRSYEGRIQNDVQAVLGDDTPKKGTKKEPGKKAAAKKEDKKSGRKFK